MIPQHPSPVDQLNDIYLHLKNVNSKAVDATTFVQLSDVSDKIRKLCNDAQNEYAELPEKMSEATLKVRLVVSELTRIQTKLEDIYVTNERRLAKIKAIGSALSENASGKRKGALEAKDSLGSAKKAKSRMKLRAHSK